MLMSMYIGRLRGCLACVLFIMRTAIFAHCLCVCVRACVCASFNADTMYVLHCFVNLLPVY
jgi:hypothetical protein